MNVEKKATINKTFEWYTIRSLNVEDDERYFQLIEKIVLLIHKDNLPSIKVAENCGFAKERIVKNGYKKTNGEIVDMIYYCKTN